MNLRDFKDTLIPAIKPFCGVPVIEADQDGDKPDEPHITFKVTSPYIKGVGQANETYNETELSQEEEFKRILSFNAYAMDEDVSNELAQSVHDWFRFHGSDFLDANNIVVSDITDVQNRDVFLVDDYERRNGFDVTLRLSRALSKPMEYIEKAEVERED